MLSQMLFHVLMVKSVKNFLYLNFQATCNVLARWVKCRWLVVAHFLLQGNFQMLTGMHATCTAKYLGPYTVLQTVQDCILDKTK